MVNNYCNTLIKVFRLESDYRLFFQLPGPFSTYIDQCKSDEKTFWDRVGVLEDCFGRKFVKVLTQDSALLHGVIAYARTHYHAG